MPRVRARARTQRSALTPASRLLGTIGGIARREADVNPVFTPCLQDIRWDSRLRSKLPDLYVVAKLGDVSKQTKVVRQNLTPSWDEVLTLSSDHGFNLTVELRHKSSWRSDPCVGSASITLDELLRMYAETEGTHAAPVFLRKKGSGAPAGALHLRLETTNLISNAELDVKAANGDIQQITRMEVGSTTIAALADDLSQLSTEGDLYKSIGSLLSKLDVFVEFIDEISKIHPYLAVAWQVASILYKGVSNQYKADKKVIDLMLAVSEAFNFVHDTSTLPDKSRNLEETIISLLKQATECCLFVKDYVRHGFAGRMFDLGLKAKIDEFSNSFSALKNKLDSGIGLHIAFVSARILDKVDAIHLRMQLNPDKMSAFDRPLCLPGTRTEIQKQIIDWMVSDSDQNIFWLYGVAGSGKSTISTTIADHFRGLLRLGAFLFFERGRSDPSSVIRTMAFGLACSDSNIANHISAAIDLDGNLASASATVQFERLILKPLVSSAADLQGPILVVLDAVDECGTFETRRTLLELFRRELHKLPKNIRILITSRRETDIEEALSDRPGSVREVELDYTSGDSQRDVLEYIRVEMTRWVKDKVSIPDDWPWEANMKLLAKAAAGLFIWASTAVKLVASHRDDPFQMLEDLVSNLRSLSRFGLDDLYLNVLRNSGISWDSEASRTRFSQVLGLILLSKTPLSISAIDNILGFPPRKSSRLILSRLQCLLAYSPDTSDKPVHFFHASFSDYLMSPERSADPWCIDIPVQMSYITTRCFSVMKEMLHFNMCNLESSFVPNDRVHGLEDRIKESIPPHLAYACLHWSQHLSESSHSSLLLGELADFVYRRLLYWFEVLSLLKRLNIGDAALSDALQWTGPSVEGLSDFITDARRLLIMFSFPISRCTPHIYMSMLPLMMKESLVAAHYSKGTSSLVSVERIGERGSTALLRLFRLDVDELGLIYTVTLSQDCTRIALGFRDGDIYLWDTESGEMVSGPLTGHVNVVTCIAFSPDGARIVSGSDDRTIRSWNAASGESMAGPFNGHTLKINSISFSPDGNLLASGSEDRTVIIWNSWSGTIISGPLRKHTDNVSSVDFSPDNARVISGSWDGTVILWDVESGQILFSLERHIDEVDLVQFSPDGARIFSGDNNGVFIVWNALTGEVVFEDYVSGVNCWNLSRDGTRIVSGSSVSGSDDTIGIWNVENGNATSTTFKGHTGDIIAINFSLDDTRVISASGNGEIGVWDVVGAKTAPGSREMHIDEILLIAYSLDGSRIISVYCDNLVRIWDVRSGEAVSKPLQGSNRGIGRVALSPDGTRLALVSYDSKVRICDIESGEVVPGPHLSHWEYVRSVDFSPDSTQLVVCSDNRVNIIWDVESGYIVYGPFKRAGPIYSFAFLSDDKSTLLGLDGSIIEVIDVGSGDSLASPFKDRIKDNPVFTLSLCGTRLAIVSDDNTIIIRDRESRQVVSTLYGPTDKVLSITFSPDGLSIASRSWDKTVRVWDVISGELILGPFIGHSDENIVMAFSPDSTSVVTGSRDGTIRIWDVTIRKTTSSLDKEQRRGGTTKILSPDHAESTHWVLDEDGWIRGGQDELLLWIPSALRPTLWHTSNTAFFGGEFQTKLDFSNCLHGKHWSECFKSTP